mmetsp:Transcript_75244/g.194001  ORF Transcript_75244/g.194001 Transcript_75244/m.194001 type:complete len:288 (-) Transcript_75244:72-935(-)
MGYINRTLEFQDIVKELTRKGGVPGADPSAAQMPTPQQQSELNVWSSEIGSGIHQASLKVQDLRRMAKQKGIFNDKTSEIQELTFSVKQDLQRWTQHIETLQAKVKGGGQNAAYQAHARNLVETLNARLMGVTKDFKDALEDRTKAMEHQDKRKQLWTAGQGNAANPFAGRQRPSGNTDDLEGGGGQQAAMSMAQGYSTSRADAVQNVQRTIGELAQMFQKMAVMVTAQEEMIQRIDDDVDNTHHNVEEAQAHLLKYFNYISSNRMLIIKVFLILLFFVIFFVVFLA